MKSQLQFKQFRFGRQYSTVLEARGYSLMPLDNSINCSETNVTVMPQITCDAVYSGSDLFSMIVYSNELSQTKPPPLVTVAQKERKKSLTRGHVEDTGSTVGIQSYKSRVRRSGVPGCVSTSSRTAKFYVMAVLSGARVVRVLCVCVAAFCWAVAR